MLTNGERQQQSVIPEMKTSLLKKKNELWRKVKLQ